MDLLLNPHRRSSIYVLTIDSFHILAMILQRFLLGLMRKLHITAQFVLLILNCIWMVVIFWPVMFYKLYSDPKGRRLYDILSNPKNTDMVETEQGSVIIKQHKRKQQPSRLRFYNRSRLIFTSPASQGAYAHVDEPAAGTVLDSLKEDLRDKQIYHDDPLRLKVPYEYLAQRLIKPPDGLLFDTLAFIAVVLTFLWPVICGYRRLLYVLIRRRFKRYLRRLRRLRRFFWRTTKKRKKKRNNYASKRKRTALSTKTISKDRYAFLAENADDSILSTWDTDGIFFCVDNAVQHALYAMKSHYLLVTLSQVAQKFIPLMDKIPQHWKAP
eukprot:scaffold18927_cov47-Cyclotella_meneghiniana.AAC.2